MGGTNKKKIVKLPNHYDYQKYIFLKIMKYNPKQPTKSEKPSQRFRGALKNLSKEQKEQNNQEIQSLRNEWQRDI